MSIVSSYASPDAAEALKRQRRMASIASLAIAILTVVLVAVVLALFLLPALRMQSSDIVAYSAEMEEEEVVEQPEITPQVRRQPSAPSSAMAKVIATTVPSPISVPVPDTETPDPSIDFGDGDDFGDGWGEGSGSGLGGGTSFFGVTSRAERIAYVIDYSASMRGPPKEDPSRADLMRKELKRSVDRIAAKTNYALIFFAGPAWVAGDEVDWTKQKATITGKGRRKYEWKSGGKAHEWEQVGKKEPVEWLSATEGQLSKSRKIIEKTPLVWGTRWDNPLQMALDMEPRPQVIYFMTDGVARGSDKWAKEIGARAKSRGIKINCVAMMQPKAHDDMDDLAKRTGGHFTIVMKGGQRKKVR
ncbi:MAG: VWA domain-containing protein [Roseibacillus sp.]|nr:VWA domain-containing protein [Roseibacillus sp.]